MQESVSYGAFKSMRLNRQLFRNIKHSVTTPIQRKVIPLIRDGQNITGIARTGSGKTLSYLVPLIDNILKERHQTNIEKSSNFIDQKSDENEYSPDPGLLATFTKLSTPSIFKKGDLNFDLLVLVPTRELCLQVGKCATQLTLKTNLKNVCFHGGTSIGRDFSKIIPDVSKIPKTTAQNNYTDTNNEELTILDTHKDVEVDKNLCIATIGRLSHILLETKKRVNCKYLVIDELDRIFDDKNMSTDLYELLEVVNYKQLAMFSATLPAKSTELVNKTNLIQIDIGISDMLKFHFFYVSNDFKEKSFMAIMNQIKSNYVRNKEQSSNLPKLSSRSSSLSETLQKNIQTSTFSEKDQVSLKNHKSPKIIVFCATKHIVLHLSHILSKFEHDILYSTMDQVARTQALSNFEKKSNLLLVTDLASRGIDIRDIDIAINYDLCDSKTFIHRIGRVARNGQSGSIFSLVSKNDLGLYYSIKAAVLSKIAESSSSSTCLDICDVICDDFEAPLNQSENFQNALQPSTNGFVVKPNEKHFNGEFSDSNKFSDEMTEPCLLNATSSHFESPNSAQAIQSHCQSESAITHEESSKNALSDKDLNPDFESSHKSHSNISSKIHRDQYANNSNTFECTTNIDPKNTNESSTNTQKLTLNFSSNGTSKKEHISLTRIPQSVLDSTSIKLDPDLSRIAINSKVKWRSFLKFPSNNQSSEDLNSLSFSSFFPFEENSSRLLFLSKIKNYQHKSKASDCVSKSSDRKNVSSVSNICEKGSLASNQSFEPTDCTSKSSDRKKVSSVSNICQKGSVTSNNSFEPSDCMSKFLDSKKVSSVSDMCKKISSSLITQKNPPISAFSPKASNPFKVKRDQFYIPYVSPSTPTLDINNDDFESCHSFSKPKKIGIFQKWVKKRKVEHGTRKQVQHNKS